MELCESLIEHRIFEVTQFAFVMLDRFASRMGARELERFEGWLERDLADNWAAVDTLCPHTVGTMVRANPELVGRVKSWSRSSNRWLRRASAVTFIL